jgi:hypothetical protein
MPLKGLSSGWHTLSVRVFFHETLAGAAGSGKQKRKLTVTISKQLTARVQIC